MPAPYCMICSGDDAIYTRGLDCLCASCAEDFDAATMGEIFGALAEIVGAQTNRRAASDLDSGYRGLEAAE